MSLFDAILYLSSDSPYFAISNFILLSVCIGTLWPYQ